MSDQRDRLEEQLDEAFASLRPRADFESELWSRIARAPLPILGRPTPAPRRESKRWAWLGAAAAVIVVGLLGFFVTRLPHAGNTASSGGASRNAVTAAAPASFGKLPRPSLSASPVAVAQTPSQGALPQDSRSAPVAPAGVVTRYREPSQAEFDAFAQSLGATGQGGRFSGPGFTVLFFPTDAGLGEPAHYVLTPAGGAPTGQAPSEAAARTAADAFTSRYRLPVPGPTVSVTTEGPVAIVRYSSQAGPALAIYVRGDGGVVQASGPLSAEVDRAPYRLASLDQLRAAAHAGPSDRWEIVIVLAFDGVYGYFEPAAAFTTPDGKRTVVPAVDPSELR
jgi:hypothetical protein